MAGSVKDEVNKDPDYTATVLLSKKDDKYCIAHAHRFRERFNTVEEYILDLSLSEDDDITYVIPVDAGAAGKAYARSLQQKLAERTGRHVILHPTGTKSKLIRFRPFASVCQSGAVSIVSASWNDWFFEELEQFVGDGKQHDDALDAAVSAFWACNQSLVLPSFQLPTLDSAPQQFGIQSTDYSTGLTVKL